MNKEKVFKYLEERLDSHIRKLQELIRQPSISGENIGVRECAKLVSSYLAELGCKDVSLVETSGYPVVYGHYEAGAKKTILVYMMYDTQPVDEPGWSVPPLEGSGYSSINSIS